MADDWRKSISFSDRLSVISQIGSAYTAAHPACQPPAASKYARTTESDVRKGASTLNEYHERCNGLVEHLLASVPPETLSLEDRHQEEPHLPDSEVTTTNTTTIGHYAHAEHINDGITSEIFRARNPSSVTVPIVALKVTNPSQATPPHDPIREARLLSHSKHAHIIELLETFRLPNGHFVLVFPYASLDLNRVLYSGRITDTSRKTILRDLFAGLAHLHGLGIIHRDVKPSNILLASPTGPALLADFGIAWSPTDPASEPADRKILDVGTTCYRPPELLFGHSAYSSKLDMWAAGCVAAQVVCLNGKTMFDAGDLGSELALIKSVFETLGTPGEETWPEAREMPDWGKMHFVKYPGKGWTEILPGASEVGRGLVEALVRFESGERMSAEEALQHPYLRDDEMTLARSQSGRTVSR